jgi:poly-gamma-glutamate capsule biosynthesis protein CapA/YwtB (metallophosphatase superfamily)
MYARAGYALAGALALLSAVAWGCSSSSSSGPPIAASGGCVTRAAGHPFTVRVHAVDETGKPVGASIDTGDGPQPLASSLSLKGPTSMTLSAEGFLKEPLVLGPGDDNKDVTVRMWSDKGGARIAIHSTGDVMLGRRYETPKAGDPLVPQTNPGPGAKSVVSSVVGLMNASDARTINLETVVADVPDTDSYRGKRYILRTRPGALAGIKDLAPMAVGLANNHTRDFKDTGIADTLAALDAANIKHVGGLKDGKGESPLVVPVGNMKVGMAAFTSVDGSFVNDSYPSMDQAVPAGLSPENQYEYDNRSWGYMGTMLNVPTAPRRIGPAWQIFSTAEPKLPDADITGGYTSLAAVYPELQDWVARRGHGGASPWDATSSVAAIKALRKSSDVVIVQLHAGFQFQEAASINVEQIVEAAIDAGADLVICHHPHIVQGLAFVKGKLVAYSMGNFVFDQDFLSTYSSAVLRTVWEGNKMLEARILPVEINAYKPAPAVDEAGRVTLDRMWERSVLRAYTNRDSTGGVIATEAALASYVVPAHFRYEHNTAVLTADVPVSKTTPIHVEAGQSQALSVAGLVDPRLGGAGPGLFVGRDVFGWGRFESELADGQGTGDIHWSNLNQCDANVAASSNAGVLRIQRGTSAANDLSANPISQIPLFHHRLYDAKGTPLDPSAGYSVHLRAKLDHAAPVTVKITLYHFDDTNPTEDPESDNVGKIELTMNVPVSEQFADVWADVPPNQVGDTQPGNSLSVHLSLGAAQHLVHLDVDQFHIVEWREASRMHDRYGRYDFIRNINKGPADLQVPFWPSSP